MARILSLITMVALCCSFTACGFLPFGGGASAWKPTEVYENQCAGDLSGAKVGQSVTYATEPGGMKTTVKVVGKEGDALLIENWTEGPASYGLLLKVSNKKIVEAYAAAKDDKEWTKITVKEPPKAQAGETPKSTTKESDEKKDVKAGSFSCRKLDTTTTIQGKDYNSLLWYSKDVPKLHMASDHGGLVAMESSGSKTVLESKADDAKPSALEMPKK
jgi:hypothetical protein